MLERDLVVVETRPSSDSSGQETPVLGATPATKALDDAEEKQRAARLVRGSSSLALLEHVELLRSKHIRGQFITSKSQTKTRDSRSTGTTRSRCWWRSGTGQSLCGGTWRHTSVSLTFQLYRTVWKREKTPHPWPGGRTRRPSAPAGTTAARRGPPAPPRRGGPIRRRRRACC